MSSIKLKEFALIIVKKLPIFLFCVFFINGYNYLCGKENSIVGVVLLMGLLILIGANLGYNATQASVSIALLFVLLAFAPKFID